MIGLATLLFPLITSGLLLVVFRKAGFSWATTCFAITPLIGAALPVAMLSLSTFSFLDPSSRGFMFLPLLSVLLGLLPVALLAFMQWPRHGGAHARSETFK